MFDVYAELQTDTVPLEQFIEFVDFNVRVGILPFLIIHTFELPILVIRIDSII